MCTLSYSRNSKTFHTVPTSTSTYYPLHSSSKLCKIMLDYRLSEFWLSQDLTHERCQLYLIALQWIEKYSEEEFLFFKNLSHRLELLE